MPMSDAARIRALNLFRAGVAAADPARAVAASLDAAPLDQFSGRLFVIAVGKAAPGMAQAALDHLTATQTLVVTTVENAAPLGNATVLVGAHPVPDETSVAAGQAVSALLEQTRPGDHMLALISGGGSALMVAPATGLSLADKAEVGRQLLASGLDITTMNMIRQHLSRLKGGGFLRAAAPARATALILSDVVGDDLRVVASGPTTAPIGSRSDARAALVSAGLWDRLPVSVRTHLTSADDEPLDIGTADNRLIGSNTQSVAAMGLAAPDARVFPHALEGDVQEAARIIAGCKKSGIWLFGGETTVRLSGNGLGGRNQELALRVALEAEQRSWPDGWVFLSGGTDGRDGPTDATGGTVDAGSLARMRAAGVDPRELLANNDSYHALEASGDLLITGPTGTNVADLQVLIRP